MRLRPVHAPLPRGSSNIVDPYNQGEKRSDILQYAGTVCVVTGDAAGMGAAAARILGELGAEVIGLDVVDIKEPVKQALKLDLTHVDDFGAYCKMVFVEISKLKPAFPEAPCSQLVFEQCIKELMKFVLKQAPDDYQHGRSEPQD